MADERALPTLEELRRIYEEGVPQKLLSGVEVKLRNVSPDRLLASGKLPDILTPVMLKALYGNPLSVMQDYLYREPQDEAAETIEWIKGVDAICAAALIDPSALQYLSLQDRLWIAQWVFLPAEALKNFRYQPRRDVDTVQDSAGDTQQAESASDPLVQADSVPV